jgi:hypothetical protein
MRDFPRRSSRRARARRELRARGTRAGARFARSRARASVDRASREVPRVSRRARAAQRGTAALTCRVRFDEHPKAPSAFEARQALVRFLSPFPREFPFRDLSDFPKGTRVKGNPKGNFWFHRGRIKRSRLGRRDRRSSTLAARAFLVGRFREGSTADALPPHCARAAAQDGGRVLAQLLARRPWPRPELRGKVRSRSALGRACLDARPPFPPLAQKRAAGHIGITTPSGAARPPRASADPR